MRNTLFVFGLFAICTTVAVAQDAGDVGLLYKFQPIPQLSANANDLLPTTFTTDVSQGIGVHFQATDSFALQSVFLFGTGTFQDAVEIEGIGSYTTDATVSTFGVELLAPYYFLHNEAVAVFLSPGLRYSRFSYEDEFDSDEFYNTEYEATYQETNLLLQLGGRATFNSFAVFSSYGLSVNFIDYTIDSSPSDANAPDPETERHVTGAGVTSTQLSIGLMYFLN